MNKTIFKQYIYPHIIAYILFFGIVISFFSPIFFQGKKLFQADIPHHEGIAKQLIDYREETGKEALWANAVYSGMPAYLIDVHYQEPLNSTIKNFIGGYIPHSIAYIFAAMLACYILLLAMGIHPYVSMMGGLAYGLSTFTIISIVIGHDGKVAAMAYMPLVLAGVYLAYQRNRWWGAILTAVGLSLEIAATHPQINYYLGVLLIIYGCNQLVVAIQNKQLRSFLYTTSVLFLAAILAIGANIGRLWNIYEYGAYSVRGRTELVSPNAEHKEGLDKRHAFLWSLGKVETMTLLVPNFYGGSSHQQLSERSKVAQFLKEQNVTQQQIKSVLQRAPTYRGEQPFTEGPMYLGAIICFLFLIGLWSVNKQQRYWLVVGTILSIILAWGKNFAVFNDLMYHYLPGYNKFRAITASIVIAQLTTVILACLVVQQLVRQGITPAIKRGFYYAVGIMATLLLSNLILSGWYDYAAPTDSSLPKLLAETLQIDRKYMLQKDTVRSLLFVLAASFAIWAYARKRLTPKQLSICLLLLIVADFYGIGKRYVPEFSYQKQAEIELREATPARQYILDNTTWGSRVLNLKQPFMDGRTCYYHQSVGGYHGAKLRRYQDLIEHGLLTECYQLFDYLQGVTKDWGNLPVLNMLNVRYFFHSPERTGVITNPNALGNAWFVQTIYPVDSPLAEMEAVKSLDPQRVAVLDTSKFEYPFSLTSLGTGSIKLLVYEPSYLVYEAEVSADGLAVFSEIYYEKGWQAWVNEEPVKPIRVNYVLRALPIPAGKHKVTFKFDPDSYRIGNRIMLVFNLLLIVSVIGAGVYIFLKRRK
jgi:hypothetical protein